MRRHLWTTGIVGLGLGSLGIVGGTAIGGDVGPLAAGYGLLVALGAVYLVTGLAIRDRVWRRLSHTVVEPMRAPDTLAGRRVF